MNRQIFIWGVLLGMVCFILAEVSPLSAVSRTHTRGRLWHQLFDDGSSGMKYHPAEWPTTDSWVWPGHKDSQAYHAKGVGFMMGGKSGGATYATTAGLVQIYGMGLASDLTKYVTYETTEDAVFRADQEAEEIIEFTCSSDIGVSVVRRSMAWSYPKYDDMIIYEYTLTNDGNMIAGGGGPRSYTDFWVGLTPAFQPSFYGDRQVGCHIGPGPMGWNSAYQYFPQYNLVSGWDANSIVWADPDPWNIIGIKEDGIAHTIASPGACGVMLLDAPVGVGDVTQPATVRFWFLPGPGENAISVLAMEMTRESIYDRVSSRVIDGGAMHSGPIYNGFWALGCGPYDLAPNESLKLVFAEVTGYGIQDADQNGKPDEFEALVRQGLLLESAIVPNEQPLFEVADAALEMYNSNYQVTKPPDPPTLTYISDAEANIVLQWESVPGAVSYNAYKMQYDKISNSINYSLIPFYDLLQSGSQNSYTDRTVEMGNQYVYAVAAVDAAGNESGKVWDHNQITAEPYIAGFSSTNEITVVPNPYRKEAEWAGPGQWKDTIVFIGLPEICTIRIYTLEGELVDTIEHTDGRYTERYNLVNLSDWEIASGMYIYHVEATGMPDFVGKFVVLW